MSFVHTYLIGHFDLCAFDAAHPVSVRPIDVARAQALLHLVGKALSEEQLTEAFCIAEDHARCVWSYPGVSEAAHRFAHGVADAEGCVVLEAPRGVVYPPGHVSPATEDGEPLSPGAAERARERNDGEGLRRAIYQATQVAEAQAWVREFIIELTGHPDFHVRGNAVFALGRLARHGHALARERIQPLVENCLADEQRYVRRQAEVTAQTIEMQLGWLFPYFDSSNPEVEVSSYAGGWVRCPTCGWRFATYDLGAFREGRCLTCRQRLRLRRSGEPG